MYLKINEIIQKPLLTEKTSAQTELKNCYGFNVHSKANKNQIKKAIESLFDVKVVDVNTSNLPGKMKRHGKHVKKTSMQKKAYVRIEQGQKIELFKGI